MLMSVFHKYDDVKPSIHGQGINFSYGQNEARRQVLFDCALTLYPGELAILTGPSGSGKTTLLTLIGALRALEEGRLIVLGHELNGMPPADQVLLRRNIGFIFQQNNLIESLTAYDNVRLAMQLKDHYTAHDFKHLPVEMLRAVGLERYAHVKPHRLSGGEQQRVAIARALTNRPSIVLADEPTAALDHDNGRQVVALLQDLARTQQCTILIVTHDSRTMDAATRIITMVDGRMVSDVDIEQQMAVCEVLKTCRVFENLGSSLLVDIARQMRLDTHAPGEQVFAPGDDRFYVLVDGRCEMVQKENGRPRTPVSLASGSFFGEQTLVQAQPPDMTVRAITPIQTLTLSKDRFLSIIHANTNLSDQFRHVDMTY